MFKKTVSLFISAVLTLGFCVSAQEVETIPQLKETRYTGAFISESIGIPTSVEEDSAASLFAQPEMPFEDYFVEQVFAFNPTIDVSAYKLPESSFQDYYLDLVLSNSYLPITTLCSYSYDNNDTILSITPLYVLSKAEFSGAKAKLEGIVERIYQYALKGQTDLEKVLFTYDKIVLDYNYDPNPVSEDTNGNKRYKDISYTPYGFSENGIAVCQGYSLLYSAVLQKLGIDNALCSSEAINHIWNYIKVDGNWYHSDATWGEMEYQDGSVAEGYVSHYYFLCSDEGIWHGEKSQWNEISIGEKPNCSSTEYESGYIFTDNQYPIYRSDSYLYFDIENYRFTASNAKSGRYYITLPKYSENKSTFVFFLISFTKIENVRILSGEYDSDNNFISSNIVGSCNFTAVRSICSIPVKAAEAGKHTKVFVLSDDLVTPMSAYIIVER